MFQKLKEFKVKLVAYCIMNNHVHILLHSENFEELGKYMQKVNTSYSQFYNELNNRVGHVFRNRYQSQPILNQEHLYHCLAYIHNNPVKAGMVNNPGDYRYSSYNDFIKNNGIIGKDVIKFLFGSDYDYLDMFKTLHHQDLAGQEKFIDTYSTDIDYLIKEFEEKNHISISSVKDKDIIKAFIKTARKETDVTLCELAEKLGKSKSTLSRYINE